LLPDFSRLLDGHAPARDAHGGHPDDYRNHLWLIIQDEQGSSGIVAIAALLVRSNYCLAFKPAFDSDIVRYKERDYYTIKVGACSRWQNEYQVSRP